MIIYKGTTLVGTIDGEGHVETSNSILKTLVRRGYVVFPSRSIRTSKGIQDEVTRIEKGDPRYGKALVFALERNGFSVRA